MANEASNGGYWPGFVGALTNVLSALVFVVVILTALAGLLGQLTAKLKADQMIEDAKAKIAPDKSAELQKAMPSASQDNVSLSASAGMRDKSAFPASQEKRAESLPKAVEIEFEENVLALDTDATRTLDARLSMPRAGFAAATARLTVFTSEFSESRRLGFVRAVAVRNYLLKRGMKPANITISVMQSKSGASADTKVVYLTIQSVP